MDNKANQPNEKYNLLSKEGKYEHNIAIATQDIWKHMADQLMLIPEHEEITDLTEEQQMVIENIMAVEEEWILEESIRDQVSLIQWYDDDEDLPQ